MSNLKVKFVSRKISKVRWKPKESLFLTGSYGDDENLITLWEFPSSSTVSPEEDRDPKALCGEKFSGCVTDLEVATDEVFFASSSLGALYMFKFSGEKFQNVHSWKNVHHFIKSTAATTAIAVKGHEVASVGEDGRLCVFNFVTLQSLNDVECSDVCSCTTVKYLRHQEVVVGNSFGYLRVWDLRTPKDSFCRLIHSRNQSSVTSMNIHPTQSHILATGHDDGSLHIWDMRQDQQPVSILEGHSAAISELVFHPTNPDFLFTSSLDGSVLQWDSSALRNNYKVPQPVSNSLVDSPRLTSATGNPWLTSETSKHRLEITSLFSQSLSCVNSLDFNGSVLIWGTDFEALYICDNIIL